MAMANYTPVSNRSTHDAPGATGNTSLDSREYVYTPFTPVVIATCTSLLSLSSIVGFLGNLLVLFLKWRQFLDEKHKPQRPFQRQIANYFVYSLALSDILAAAVSIPLFAIQKSTDVFQTQKGCRAVRFVCMVSPFVTLTNLLVIATERYIGIFYPLRSPTRKFTKRLLGIAWLVGIILAGVSALFVRLIPYNLGTDQYTYKCKADLTIPAHRIGVYLMVVFCYVLPSLLLMYSCFAISRFIRSKECLNNITPVTDSNNPALKAEAKKYRTSKLFVSVILTFILPYFVFTIHMIVYAALKVEMGVVFDFIIPYAGGILSLSNCAVNPFIYITGSRDLKKYFNKYVTQRLPWKRPQNNPILESANRNEEIPQGDHERDLAIAQGPRQGASKSSGTDSTFVCGSTLRSGLSDVMLDILREVKSESEIHTNSRGTEQLGWERSSDGWILSRNSDKIAVTLQRRASL